MRISLFVLMLSVSLLPAGPMSWLLAQGTEKSGPEQPDLTIDGVTRARVVENLGGILDQNYVFPETAAKMKAGLDARLKSGAYDSVTSAKEFAKLLTTHLQDISRDKHLRVRYSHEKIQEPGPRREPSPEERARFQQFAARRNFGFEKLEILAGNVGYLDLRGFLPATAAGETAVAAMNFLSNADALIIDLRRNGGGDPAMVALLCSYLFAPEEEKHLNDLYFRPENSTHQYWTLPYVPGKRFAGKPVYVLTAKRTFSAAEEFTYNLQNLKRATIVGEVTGGGAHPGGGRRLDDHFGAFIPSGRAISPVTKTNWEGTGVKPDMEMPQEQALAAAHSAALEKLIEASASDARRKDELKRALGELQNRKP